MIYPNGTDKQMHLLEVIELQGFTRSKDLLLKGAIEEGSRPGAIGRDGDIDGGVIAALILLLPLVMAVRHKKIIGLGASKRAVMEWLVQKSARGVSLRHLDGIWAKYRSVAHLWAVFLMAEDVPTEDREMRAFLAAAEEVRQLAEVHKHKNGAGTLVEAGAMWELPEGLLPPIKFDLDLNCIELPPALLAAACGT